MALRAGSSSAIKAENEGLKVASIVDAVKSADVVMVLAPDEIQSHLYQDEIEPNLKEGAPWLLPWICHSLQPDRTP